MMAETDIERASRLAAHLPEVEVSTWYGTPSLKVAGKGFLRVKEPGVVVVMCPLKLKEALMESEPEAFFETPHYSSYAAMLVRMEAVDDARLKNRIECAWMQKAPKRLVKGFS